MELLYRRSLGPVVGAFLTGLRDQTVLASRNAAGRVICPPLEYDPESGDAVDELVPVGPAGVVTGWSWVLEPLRKQKLFEAQVEMFMYAQGLADEHRQQPDDDIITAVLSAEVDGESLSDMDFNLFFLLLAVAGNETTRNAIAHGMNAFLENPDQYDLLASDPDRYIRGAVEEVLRWATPVLYFRRNATQDFELRGHAIRDGDKISMWYISANRDEDHFDDPFRFDITRDPNHHIAFGGGGPHFCLGAQLAHWEIQVLFEELVARVPRVDALGPPDRLRSNFIGGIKHLPVRFHTT